MVTIYDLLEVREDASKEEIGKAYRDLALEYKVNPSLSEKENKENEMVLNKLKIAYEILMDDEKRKKYDKDLAQKRAEELLRNVSTSSDESDTEDTINEEKSENVENRENVTVSSNGRNIKKTENIKKEYNNSNKNEESYYDEDEENEYDENEEVVLSKKDQKSIQKAAQKDFKNNLKKAQKIEEEYNQAYNKAYNDYLRKLGYKVKEPITLKRIAKTIITILVIIIVCFILWKIPPIHKILVNVYEDNIIIKSLVDIVKIIFQSIFSFL